MKTILLIITLTLFSFSKKIDPDLFKEKRCKFVLKNDQFKWYHSNYFWATSDSVYIMRGDLQESFDNNDIKAFYIQDGTKIGFMLCASATG